MSKPKLSLTRRMIQMTKPQSDWLLEKASDLEITVPELVRRILDDYRGEFPSKRVVK